MKFQTVILLLLAIQAAVASPCKAQCKSDGCLNGLLAAQTSGKDDCRSIFSATTTPIVTETSTSSQVTVIQTSRAPEKRHEFNIPDYAAACSNPAQYISACSCVGVTALETTTTPSTVTSTTTPTSTTTEAESFPIYTILVVANYPTEQSSTNIYASSIYTAGMFWTMSLQSSRDNAVVWALYTKDGSLQALTGLGTSSYNLYTNYNTAAGIVSSGISLAPDTYLAAFNSPKGVWSMDAAHNLKSPWSGGGDAAFWACNGRLYRTEPNYDFTTECTTAVKITLSAIIL
ncbi:hypothetical protein BGZ61DRAFT_533161 [Ilyonectria robusta]|uniref:uncharacterized protein n=1 Tax=Ilyonectria robusta TaxID=1079257 RepID=UPI001E8DE748|nr:uncharacterized protein BGZ61DRAFT_533161 [Ilyonectria robusta]KAH8688377.1 hypothetical protein BGZ61DRAFT_533161 [Ilyonectria robusta]